ncbi:tRNA(Ile)-lysidine synthetase [Fusobacterium equinum]|uniref:tRNA(Ile)-lysidine synthase n=1 Tax=Fusobacterium equinum TaxID=134605 RepID=A0A133NA18_9FUSO|nr:tRNA lysidine(34) synthetase TilS [Fusobacterium equinum]KXA13122.1 tRNA(Ile)-lysidine synthetase [Fusobacterium equinum]
MQGFQKFLKDQKKYQYIQEGDRILVAFSGGPDSVFLVEMLLQLQEQLSFQMLLLHLHHMIRQEDADRDYQFCLEYARKKNLEIIAKKLDVPSYAKENRQSLEEAGRNLRYKFFQEIRKEKSYHKIATAHHLDDHLETFFFRLLRGSSMEGLAGISRKQGDRIRPLRDFEKKEILFYLEEHQIPYCHDKTNEEVEYSRNRIRLELLPQFDSYNPKWKEKVASFMEELEENKKGKSIDWRDYSEEDFLNVTKLQKEREYLQKKIIYEYILSKQISVNRKQIHQICTLLKKGGSLSYDLKNFWKFKKEYDRIWIEPIKKEEADMFVNDVEIKVPGEVYFQNYRIKILVCEENRPKGNQEFLWNWDGISSLKVRNFQEGDRIQLAGMKTPKKVKEIFINEKVPREQRKQIPILIYGEEIIALGNLRQAKWNKTDDGKIICIKIEEVRR